MFIRKWLISSDILYWLCNLLERGNKSKIRSLTNRTGHYLSKLKSMANVKSLHTPFHFFFFLNSAKQSNSINELLLTLISYHENYFRKPGLSFFFFKEYCLWRDSWAVYNGKKQIFSPFSFLFTKIEPSQTLRQKTSRGKKF